jgi:hypothetical protein
MTILNLTSQSVEYTDIAPKLNKLKTLMDARKAIWDKLPDEKKLKWVKSDKDPIMALAVTVYKYLDKNFFGDLREGING